MLLENSFQENITTDQMLTLPLVEFPGDIIVVEHTNDIKAMCEDLLACPVIGFDTETRPSFKAGVMHKVSLLQLSTPKRCYLFRLCRMPLDRAIIKVLESKDTIKVGADVANDIKALRELRHFKPEGFLDLQSVIHEWGVAEKSVRKMASIVLGHRISKAKRLSNWEAINLTTSQQSYAATDAWVCLRIHDTLAEIKKNPLPIEARPPKKKNKDKQVNLRKNGRTQNNTQTK